MAPPKSKSGETGAPHDRLAAAQVGASPPPAPSRAGGYETIDGDESLRYIKAGGRLISCVRQFPNNPFKAGKRYTFLESKAELDALVEREENG